MPKTGTFKNQVQITRQEPCDWPAAHRTCFWLEKARYTWFCLLCLAFNCFWRIVSQSEAIHLCPDTYPTTSHSNGLIYGYTYEVSSRFTRTYRLLMLAEKIWITADQSQINLDSSPVRMLTMWLLRTLYIATTMVYSSNTLYSCIMSVTTKTKHSHIYE